MFEIVEHGFDEHQIIHFGNKFIIGTLECGIRGTLDEFRKEELVAVNLPLIYDQVGSGWRESINSPNPLFTKVFVNGVELNVLKEKPLSHKQWLDLKTATMYRETVFGVDDIELTLKTSRFVSLTQSRYIVQKIEVSTNIHANVDIILGIDYDVWDIHGPHLESLQFYNGEEIIVNAITHEKHIPIRVTKRIVPIVDSIIRDVFEDSIIGKQVSFETVGHKTYTIESFSHIEVNPELLYSKIIKGHHETYDEVYDSHKVLWNKRWEIADAKIEANPDADLALRYSIYQLLLLTPNIKDASIPARGISGQTYKGAIFWDTEIFMLPFFLNVNPEASRNLITYRIHGLKGAKEKASYYGYKGAFYAWESHEDGFDACSDYNVTDVFTNRALRTYFKDKQVHISGDIIYALNEYLNHTKDVSILKDGALEMAIEVARFYLSYGRLNMIHDRFEMLDCMGPDEYHERVHNNLFTNLLVKFVFEFMLKMESYFESIHDAYFINTVNKLDFWQEFNTIKGIVKKVYIKQPDESGIFEQFDGYFKLKDIKKDELLNQRLHPNEYLGGHGLAGDTQIIKQADVIAAMYLFKDQFDSKSIQKNWEYYEPRTEHGSSLSASMYALTACMINQPDYAYPLFMKSATVDLTGDSKHYAGSIYIGGTHPAASGGAYMTAIFGFAGLTFENDKINVHPRLPKNIKGLSFKVIYQGKVYQVNISDQQGEVIKL